MNVSFTLAGGEILGVAGVANSGQKELCESIAGLVHADKGRIFFEGENIVGKTPRDIIKLGIRMGFIPEDRLGMGLVGSMDIVNNMILKDYQNQPGIRLRKGPCIEKAKKIVAALDIQTPSINTPVKKLSGGNIQKVVVAREFSGNPVLILADQPTRGIDVGATEFIRKKLVELSRSGIAVLLISADLAEVMELSDSLIVMHGGKIAAYFEDTSTLTDDVMGEYMLGLKTQSEEEIRRVCHD